MGIYNIQDPENIIEVGVWDDVNEANFFDIAIVGNRAYMVGVDRMVVLDVTDKSNPQKVAEATDIKKGLEVTISGGFAYVADNGDVMFEIAKYEFCEPMASFEEPQRSVARLAALPGL